MPKAPRRPPQLRGRIFRGSAAVSRGLLTRNDLRSSAWRSLFRDVYADSHLTVTHRDRCAAVMRWLVPTGTAIAGRSAAALYGVGRVAPDEPVDVLTPIPPPEATGPTTGAAPIPPPEATGPTTGAAHIPLTQAPGPATGAAPIPLHEATGAAPIPLHQATGPATGAGRVPAPSARRRGPAAGLRVHRAEVAPEDVVDRAGVVVTTPARTCWDLARWLDVVEAVVIIDGLLTSRLTDVTALREYALARAGQRGWRSLLPAVELADPGSESPQESRTRVRLVLAGLPRPQTQWVVSDRGRFVARLDLAWPEFKVAVEYDGLWHDDPEQFHRDRRRLNQLLGGDWIVLHVTAKRLREDFAGFLVEVRAALHARGLRARS